MNHYNLIKIHEEQNLKENLFWCLRKYRPLNCGYNLMTHVSHKTKTSPFVLVKGFSDLYKMSEMKVIQIDTSKLGSTQQWIQDMLTLTCCQDHILTENIWFVWSETSFSGDERWCHGCGTTNQPNEQTLKIELSQCNGSRRFILMKVGNKLLYLLWLLLNCD